MQNVFFEGEIKSYQKVKSLWFPFRNFFPFLKMQSRPDTDIQILVERQQGYGQDKPVLLM